MMHFASHICDMLLSCCQNTPSNNQPMQDTAFVTMTTRAGKGGRGALRSRTRQAASTYESRAQSVERVPVEIVKTVTHEGSTSS